jgi:hypothetical protein
MLGIIILPLTWADHHLPHLQLYHALRVEGPVRPLHEAIETIKSDRHPNFRIKHA